MTEPHQRKQTNISKQFSYKHCHSHQIRSRGLVNFITVHITNIWMEQQQDHSQRKQKKG